MNIQFNYLLSVILAGALLVIPGSDTCADAVDEAHQKNANSRTWTVWGADPGPPPHLNEGDQFRIQKAGAVTSLVPLRGLLSDWGKSPGFEIRLTKVNGPNPSVKILCGCSVIHGGESHVFRVFPVPGTNDEVTVDYDHVSACDPVTHLPDPESLCQEDEIHGGTAHAEN